MRVHDPNLFGPLFFKYARSLTWKLPDSHSALTTRGKSGSRVDSGPLLDRAQPISFKDACQLMSEPAVLATTSHLVSLFARD